MNNYIQAQDFILKAKPEYFRSFIADCHALVAAQTERKHPGSTGEDESPQSIVGRCVFSV